MTDWEAKPWALTIDGEIIRPAGERAAVETLADLLATGDRWAAIVRMDAPALAAALLAPGQTVEPKPPFANQAAIDRAKQANEVAEIVIRAVRKLDPSMYVPLDLRYGIADTLWAAGYRKTGPSQTPEPPRMNDQQVIASGNVSGSTESEPPRG